MVYNPEKPDQHHNMDETLRQLGQLLLGAIPTILFMLLLWGSYAVLVHKPLTQVLAERRRRTEGAIEKARADIARAEARTAEYEQRLREARIALFHSQEERRARAMAKRAQALAEARTRAQAHITQARQAIENDKIEAQDTLQSESGRLAAEIVRVILQPGSAPVPVGGGR
jgi:F-type H+-transporting ATPase subunit b